MKQFANELQRNSEALKKEERLLFQELSKLGATWKDQRFQHFDRLITESARELTVFHTASARYADFLRRKAVAAEKFLRG
jgi:hypothetical protein